MSTKKLTIVSWIFFLFVEFTLDCKIVFSQVVPDNTLGADG